MRRCFVYIVLSLFGFLPQTLVHAADKIRIGFPDLAAPFVPLAVGDKRGFFQEEGIVAESIRMNPAVALQALVSGEIDYYTVLGPGVAAARWEKPARKRPPASLELHGSPRLPRGRAP